MRRVLDWLLGWLRPKTRKRRRAFAVPRVLAAKPKAQRSSLATHLLARRPDPPAD